MYIVTTIIKVPSCPINTKKFPPFLTSHRTDLYSISIILSFQDCYTHGIIKNYTFGDCYLEFSRFMQIVAYISIAHFFLLPSHIPLSVPHFIHSPIGRHLDWVITNTTTINIFIVSCVNISFHVSGINAQKHDCLVV